MGLDCTLCTYGVEPMALPQGDGRCTVRIVPSHFKNGFVNLRADLDES